MSNIKQLVYYTLSPSTNSKETGVWEQLDVPSEYYNVENNFKVLDFKGFPVVDPNLDNFILKKGAKLTDVLSAFLPNTSIGVFVSEGFKKIIEQNECIGGRFYHTSIISDNKDSEKQLLNSYYFLHLIKDVYDIIDFENSEFINFAKKTTVSISKDQGSSLPKLVKPRLLVLKKQVDIFRSPYNVEILVSERFKDLMKQEKITGVYFEEYTNNKFFIKE